MRDEAARLPLRDVKAMLSNALGPKYVSRLDEDRARDAYRAWLIVASREGRDRARDWYAAPNSRLGDPRRSPARAIRDGAGGLVVAAAVARVQDGWSA